MLLRILAHEGLQLNQLTTSSAPSATARRERELMPAISTYHHEQSMYVRDEESRQGMDRGSAGNGRLSSPPTTRGALLVTTATAHDDDDSDTPTNNPLFKRHVPSPGTKPWSPRGIFDSVIMLVEHEVESVFGGGSIGRAAAAAGSGERRLRRWFPVLTVLTSLVCIFVYVYMVAQWPGYRLAYCSTFPRNSHCNLEELASQAPLGPLAAWKTLVLGETPYWRFDGDYIIAWGARYSPMLRYEKGQWWRWVTSFYVHLSRGHIVGNMTMYIPVGGLLEWRFGPFRFLLVLLVTIIGGNMFSALLEQECYFYAGASSGVYGVLGMQLADAFYNYDRTAGPLVRMGFTFFMVGQQVYQEVYQDVPISSMCHLGSLLMGFFAGFLVMMTHIPPSKWQLVVGVVGLAGLVAGAIWLPLAVYGEIDFFSHNPFKNSTHQCCYSPPQYDIDHYGHGWDQVCRTFPRPEALQALPVKYNLPVNHSWWVTGKPFTEESVTSILQLKESTTTDAISLA